MSRLNPSGTWAIEPQDLGRQGTPLKLGYQPSYAWRNFPLNNTPPQYVFSTYAAAPFSVEGTGDIPRQRWLYQQAPVWVGSSFALNGLPTSAGTVFQMPLTFAPAVGNPLQYMYPGTGS